MVLTDLFIKRPVLAIVVSLAILVLGLRSMTSLPVRQYPFTQNAVVTIQTTYTGANPELIAGFITTTLENSIAQASGIDYMTSSSVQGLSTISVNLQLNYDPLKAVADITTKVNAVLNQLPTAAQLPRISVAIGQTIDAMYIGFYSDTMPLNNITDYLIRVVQPKLQAIDGVQQAEILGGQTFAMRAWIDPAKLAGFNLSSQDVALALSNNNFISAVGRTDGQMFIRNLISSTDLNSVKQFKNMVIKQSNGAIIRLSDVADVNLGAQSYDSSVSFDGKTAVYIGIKVTPAANILTVIKDVKNIYPSINEQLPSELQSKIVYDSTKFISSSISEVITTLIEAFIIVTIVIYLFLGSIHSVNIPMVAIPLSLIGTFFIMLILGFTINLLTLLALVLAIGLVVDDAIVVVENVQRHLEEGESKLKAALLGARELVGPIIATTVVLIAVYLPIGFLGGLTGTLFTEFAFTLAGSVTISAIIALTLSPMMCSKLLRNPKEQKKIWIIRYADSLFNKVQHRYMRALKDSLDYLPVTIVFAIIILLSNYFLFIFSKNELAPQEDQGVIISLVTAAANASLQQTQLYANEVNKIFSSFPETDHIFQIDGASGLNTSIVGMVLKPWDERKRSSNQLQPMVQQEFNNISGAKVVAFQPPSLPGGGSGAPIQFVIKTTDTFSELNQMTQSILAEAQKSGVFIYLDSDLKIDKQQTNILIDRDKASELGLNMKDIGNSLSSFLSQNYINFFDYSGRSYQVIPQVLRLNRLNAEQLLDYYVTTSTGKVVPFSTIATLQNETVPESLNHFQQLNSSTISAVAFPGVTMGQALEKLQAIASNILSANYYLDYASQSRQYIQEGAALVFTFFFALIIIFLSLAALFESFRDPFIVLISVPMSICGAMIFICVGVGDASLNIYSEVGLITLIGLISKNGILIVQFANDLQMQGKSKREALEEAALIRLRPILMTSIATVLGVVPLIIASGAGAVSRFNIGLVIGTGISIGTLFTLFVVPAMYLLLAEDLTQKRNSEMEDFVDPKVS